MKQMLHIFRKDVRHLWREIAASLALLVAFAWLDIRSWSQPYGEGMATGVSALLGAEMLPGLVNLLLPLSWIFLIVRVIQGESLVGDRQFWVTRPYDWKQLLAAKTLFVLTFVNFPLLLTGCLPSRTRWLSSNPLPLRTVLAAIDVDSFPVCVARGVGHCHP